MMTLPAVEKYLDYVILAFNTNADGDTKQQKKLSHCVKRDARNIAFRISFFAKKMCRSVVYVFAIDSSVLMNTKQRKYNLSCIAYLFKLCIHRFRIALIVRSDNTVIQKKIVEYISYN